MSQSARLAAIGFSLLILVGLASLQWGAVSDLDVASIIAVRLPRTVLAIGVGMGLALAGSLLQVLFQNALCEPYTLGLSSGAALGAVIATTFGISMDWSGVNLGALAGALVFGGGLWMLARFTQAATQSLLLAGVMLSFLGSSAMALWISIADPTGVQNVLYWLLGDLSLPRLPGALVVLSVTAVVGALAWGRSSQLDALLMGEEMAVSVGVETHRLRRTLIILTSLLVAVAVGSAGMIGFVGLVVPHFVRHFVGSRHRRVLPLAALWGGVVLLFSDWIARLVVRPQEVPAGVITALWGAPAFIYLLLRRRRS